MYLGYNAIHFDKYIFLVTWEGSEPVLFVFARLSNFLSKPLSVIL